MDQIYNNNDRTKFLTEVDGIINGERSSSYGDPAVGFDKTARAFSAITGHHLMPVDVVVFNILQKLERLSHSPNHRDSWLDIAGYAALGSEITATPSDQQDGLPRIRSRRGGSIIITTPTASTDPSTDP